MIGFHLLPLIGYFGVPSISHIQIDMVCCSLVTNLAHFVQNDSCLPIDQ
jgi:hypothetical protein